MVGRSALKAMARLALAALLFAQAAVVLAACESVRRAPALAIASAEHLGGGENCHEQGINVNLCLVHCLGEDQSLDKPAGKVQSVTAPAILFVQTPLRAMQFSRAPRSVTVPPATAPPPRILFQSFLI